MEEDVWRMKIPDPGDERWKNFDPIKESDMEIVAPRLTVCELLREIYKKTDDPEIKMKCRMATTMAKKMALMITEIKGAWWGRDYYPWNPNRRFERFKAKYDKRKGEEEDDNSGTG